MKFNKLKISVLASLVAGMLFATSCGNNAPQEAEETTSTEAPSSTTTAPEETTGGEPASERKTLEEYGVGKIKKGDVVLADVIDQQMATAGADLFKTNCTACHKIEKRFIGPSPKGILERRTPEWIMNMILDPRMMTEQDQCAKDLMVEFNGAAMANQNLTVEQARSIVEYFRTL